MGPLLTGVLMMTPSPEPVDEAQVPAQPERVQVVPVDSPEAEASEGEAQPPTGKLDINTQVPEFELDQQELNWSSPAKDFTSWDAMPSINLGLGLAWHPGNERRVGFNGELLFGAVLWDLPTCLWPTAGINVGTAKDRAQVTGVLDLGVGLVATLYYHVGFEGGLTVDGLAYGPRHGPSLRLLQFFGLEFRHKVFFAHTEPGVVRHDLTLNFSVDFGTFIGMATGNWRLW